MENLDTKIEELEQKIEKLQHSIDKLIKIFFWTLIIAVILFVLPLAPACHGCGLLQLEIVRSCVPRFVATLCIYDCAAAFRAILQYGAFELRIGLVHLSLCRVCCCWCHGFL